jgi:HD superfamily phosphohydrolase YqeK
MNAYRIQTSKRGLWIDLDKIIYITDPMGQDRSYAAGFTIVTVNGEIPIIVGVGSLNKMTEQENHENMSRSMSEIITIHRELVLTWRGFAAFDHAKKSPR